MSLTSTIRTEGAPAADAVASAAASASSLPAARASSSQRTSCLTGSGSTSAGWRVGLKGGGYKLGLSRAGGDPVVSQPIYKKNDPNCCPTGGFDHVRYHWNGTRFAKARAWHTKAYRP